MPDILNQAVNNCQSYCSAVRSYIVAHHRQYPRQRHGWQLTVSAKLNGGDFRHAFLSAGFTAAFKPLINDIGGSNSANTAIKEGNLAKLEIHKLTRIIAAGVIGGTASTISGGKFANGAVTGALTQMFNGESTSKNDVLQEQIKKDYAALEARITQFANDNPDAKIPISTEELKLVANALTIRAEGTHSFMIWDKSLYGVFADFDSFFYNYASRDFLWDGNVYKGGILIISQLEHYFENTTFPLVSLI